MAWMRNNVLIVMAVMSSLPLPQISASIFSALGRGFEHQEEIKFTATRLSQTEGLEERKVPAKTWVCTKQPSANDSESSQVTVFLRLFEYLDGKNIRGERLPMGVPVSIEAAGTREKRNLTACFFLPEKVQIDPPAPTDSLVTLVHRPSLTILTKEFGGYANSEATWDAETEKLKKLVKSVGITTDPNLVFWNAYDPPLKFWSRRNEVWLVKA